MNGLMIGRNMLDVQNAQKNAMRLLERLGLETPKEMLPPDVNYLHLVPVLHAMLDRIEAMEKAPRDA